MTFMLKKSFMPSELEGRKFAIREKGSGTRKLFERYLSANNIHIQAAWEANCPRTIMNAVLYNQMLAVISQRLVKHECIHGSVKIFRYETGEWDRNFKLVYLKKEEIVKGDTGHPAVDRFYSRGVEILRNVLERYRTLNLPQDIPACVFKNNV